MQGEIKGDKEMKGEIRDRERSKGRCKEKDNGIKEMIHQRKKIQGKIKRGRNVKRDIYREKVR